MLILPCEILWLIYPLCVRARLLTQCESCFRHSYSHRRETNTTNFRSPAGLPSYLFWHLKIIPNVPPGLALLKIRLGGRRWPLGNFYIQRWCYSILPKIKKLPEILKTPGTPISFYLHISAPCFVLLAHLLILTQKKWVLANYYFTRCKRLWMMSNLSN